MIRKKQIPSFQILLPALLLLAFACSSHVEEPLPPVVLITVDTLRSDRLGCTGYEKAKTPVIDGLAEAGALFDNCIVSTPITLPSHGTILTGLLPHEMEVRNNRPRSLSRDADTLAERFKERGYQTVAVVSGEPLAPGCGLEQGFDRYTFMPGARSDKALLLETPADRTTNLAIQALGSRDRTKPLFLWIHYFDPHFPYEPPERFLLSTPTPYDGEIAFVDEEIGRFISALKREELLEKTLITLISDHGEGLGEHGELTHAFFLFDTTIRVPLIFKGPLITKRGACHSQVRAVDLMDTLLVLADAGNKATYPTSPEARELVAFLTAADARPPASNPAFSESLYCYQSFRWAQLTSLRTADRKLIRGKRDDAYDLAKDPEETTPLDFDGSDEGRGNHATAGKTEWNVLAAQMDSLLSGAQSKMSSGPAFQQELPGYFGGGLDPAEGVFLTKKRNRSLPHPPDRADLVDRLLSGVAMCTAGQLNGARARLQSIVDEDPDNPTALFWLARVVREMGEREGSVDLLTEAHRLFKRTLAADPENRDAFNMGVWCLIQLGAFEDALEALDMWTRDREMCAKNLELYGYLHVARISAGKMNPVHNRKLAFEYFDRSLVKNGNNMDLLGKLIEMSHAYQDRTREIKYSKQLDNLQNQGWR